jgi:hypothetical protein
LATRFGCGRAVDILDHAISSADLGDAMSSS